MALQNRLDAQYGKYIRDLRTLFVESCDEGDQSTREKCSYGLSLLQRATEALESGDEGSVWLNLSGAMGFGKMAGLPSDRVDKIRAAVDVLFEA